MQYFDNITEAADAVNEWFWSRKASLAADLVETIQPLLGPTKSAIDLAVKAAETIYARRADLDGPTLQLGAGLALFCQHWGLHALDADNRGQRMALALRRDSGEVAPEGRAWPDKTTDPTSKGV